MSIDAITVSRSLVATSSCSRSVSCAAIALNARASGTNSAGSALRAARADQSPWPKRIAMPAIISIGPILAIGAIRTAIEASGAPVVAVSPIVGGKVLKGPTTACLSWAGATADAAGVARHYGPLIDAIVADEPVEGVRSRDCDTWMGSSTARRQLAAQTLELADTLTG